MYPGGVRTLVEGWSKNIASGAAATDRVAMVASVLWIAAQVTVAVRATVGLADWALGRAPAPLLALAAYAVVALQLRFMLRRIGSFRAWTALAFPVPLAAFVAIFLRSCVLTFVRREVKWRDRAIRLGARARVHRG
jgi:4,4'-diaponeurosporenoate glycosyltransferase